MPTMEDLIATALAAAEAAAASATTAATSATHAADTVDGAISEGVAGVQASLDTRLGNIDHGSLLDLGADDHLQYHTDARGDARYLATTAPAGLGATTLGISTKLAREDHAHAMPRLDQLLNPTAARAMNGQKLTELADGTAAQDAVTKAQLDTVNAKVQVVTSATRPAHSEGRMIYETDTDRFLISDGAVWKRFGTAKDARGVVAQQYDPGYSTAGDVTWAPTGVFVSDGTRKYKFEAVGFSRCQAQANTGHTISLRYRVNGGAWVDIDARNVIQASGTSDCVWTFWCDFQPPAGDVECVVRTQGLGINGNVMGGIRVCITDIGGV